ncbi:uncharacterized protein LOC106670811 [Cimex lectularius]|uniref:Uncharacterized protein n=1 Tax=Cimex lectularius TaxID=79782 RepID=A0A8I6SBR9_CIMLE|nr:uncharacterized protein LOC106670811 [Cimex lectularius]
MENPKTNKVGSRSGSERFDEFAEKVAEKNRVYAKTDVLQRLITAALKSKKKDVDLNELRRMIGEEDKEAVGEAVKEAVLMGLMVKRQNRLRVKEEVGCLLGEKRGRRRLRGNSKRPRAQQREKRPAETCDEPPATKDD